MPPSTFGAICKGVRGVAKLNAKPARVVMENRWVLRWRLREINDRVGEYLKKRRVYRTTTIRVKETVPQPAGAAFCQLVIR